MVSPSPFPSTQHQQTTHTRHVVVRSHGLGFLPQRQLTHFLPSPVTISITFTKEDIEGIYKIKGRHGDKLKVHTVSPLPHLLQTYLGQESTISSSIKLFLYPLRSGTCRFELSITERCGHDGSTSSVAEPVDCRSPWSSVNYPYSAAICFNRNGT